MYGRSPLSEFVFCEATTAETIPPEHQMRYQVITPFGSTGGFQVNMIDVELRDTIMNLSGGDPGPVDVRYNNSAWTISVFSVTHCLAQ